MSTISSAEARERFAQVVNRAAFEQERIVLTRRGKPLAAIVPIEDQQDIADAKAALQDYRKNGGISIEALKAQLGQ